MKHYIGLDAHSKTCTYVVLSDEAEILQSGKFLTSERNLIEMVRSIEGEKALVVEETNLAQWIYVTLKDELKELVICHPAYLPMKSGPKTDFRDALHLATQLRAKNITPVYHEDSPLMNLRTVMHDYEKVIDQVVDLKNRFKALLRSEGIEPLSAYNLSKSDKCLDKIKVPTKKLVADKLLRDLKHCEKRKLDYHKEFEKNEYKISLINNLKSIPGIGSIRAHQIAAYIACGERFKNKHKLWSYAMLVRHEDRSDGAIIRRRKARGRTELKDVFIGAAFVIINRQSKSALKDYYNYLIEKRNLQPRDARKALARQVAAISLAVMKKGCWYDEAIVEKMFK